VSIRKVVVTGATGHLGRSVVELLSKRVDVVAASRAGVLPSGADSTSVSALALDIADEGCVAVLSRELGADVALVHLAAWHPPRTAGTTPSDRSRLLEVNVHGTMRVLEAARRSAGQAHVAAVVYASTFEVYGQPEHTGEVRESDRLSPVTDYGATKLSGEDHLLAFGYEEQARVVALRLPAIYGPGEVTERALPNFLRRVARQERPVIAGAGEDLRDQVHVRDAARAVELAVFGSAHGIFNVADGHAHSIAELAREALRVAELPGEPEFVPAEKPRYDFHMNIELARRELGFLPTVSLEDGMREQLEWLRRGAPS
jgi:nucleoside-diphosphate-sugar epimerase